LAPVTQPVPAKRPVAESDIKLAAARHTRSTVQLQASASDDGTNQLLKWGGWTLGTGIFLALLTKFALGGIGPQGPHTNSGWMALIITMMCLPFGFMLFLLGALKWLRNRRSR